MKQDTRLNDQQLEDAFGLFNEMSLKLASSYGDLELKVEQLSRELSEARSERLAQLAEKESLAERLEKLLDTLPAGVVVLGDSGEITQTNPVADEMLGKPGTGGSWEELAQRVFITDGDELRLKDGRWLSLSVSPLGTGGAKIMVLTDITKTRELQLMLNRQQRLTSLGEMVASLAHQIRTPLSSVLLHLSNMATPRASTTDRQRYIQNARQQLHHMERLVSDMLLFARGDAAESEYLEVSRLMMELYNSIEPGVRKSGGRLNLTNQSASAHIRGNRDALIGAFQNLVDNAVQAMPEGLVMEIKVFHDTDNAITFMFKDNGPGMSEHTKERVLEPFFTTRNNGTGLGLAVVNATVRSHDGELQIDSVPGEGTRISISLPNAGKPSALPGHINQQDENIMALPHKPRYQGNYIYYFLDNHEVQQ